MKLPKSSPARREPLSGPATAFWSEAAVFRHPEQPVAAQRVRQTPTVLHRHAFTELVLIPAGHGRHRTPHGDRPLAPGGGFVILPGGRHGYADTHGLEVINILFRNQFLQELPAVIRAGPGFVRQFRRGGGRTPSHVIPLPGLTAAEFRRLCDLAEEILEETRYPRADSSELLRALALELVVRLCRAAEAGRRAGGGKPAATEDGLARILRRLETAPVSGATVKLPELATAAHLSVRSLLRHFRERTGTTPGQYQLRLRITQACRRLQESPSTAALTHEENSPVSLIDAAASPLVSTSLTARSSSVLASATRLRLALSVWVPMSSPQ